MYSFVYVQSIHLVVSAGLMTCASGRFVFLRGLLVAKKEFLRFCHVSSFLLQTVRGRVLFTVLNDDPGTGGMRMLFRRATAATRVALPDAGSSWTSSGVFLVFDVSVSDRILLLDKQNLWSIDFNSFRTYISTEVLAPPLAGLFYLCFWGESMSGGLVGRLTEVRAVHCCRRDGTRERSDGTVIPRRLPPVSADSPSAQLVFLSDEKTYRTCSKCSFFVEARIVREVCLQKKRTHGLRRNFTQQMRSAERCLSSQPTHVRR